MSFSELFGGEPLLPSNNSLLKLTIAVDTPLQWPIEQQIGGNNVVADIMEITASVAGLSISFADARVVSQGLTTYVNNVGAETFTVESATGVVIASIASGEVWAIYLDDNTTENGSWKIFEFGAGTSSANAAALAGAGIKAIATTLNQMMAINSQNANYAIVDGDRAKAVQWTGASGTFTLPNAVTLGTDWFAAFKNSGTGSVTITPSAGTIDGGSSLILAVDESTFIVSDGTNYFTVGFGQEVNSVFDFVSLDVSGTGDFPLTGASLNRISYRFTGILTGNRNIIVPAAVQQYWVDNQTTGAFTLTVKTAAGTGELVPQSQRRILYCDGVNVVSAETFIIAAPVQINQGGTGEITAPAALTALGGAALTTTMTAGNGLTGGGDLSANRTFDVGAGTGITVGANDVGLDTTNTRNVDHAGVSITAGNGLTGGGDITVSRTLDVGAGLGITVNANDVQLDTANTRNVDHAAVSVTGATSVTGGGAITASQVLSLLNDVASPGNNFVYGTNGGGTKGWYSLAAIIPTVLLATNGYISFGGLTIQWGTSASVGAGGTSAEAFAVTYSAAYMVVITGTNTGGVAQAADVVTGLGTTGFTINNAASVSRTFYWISVGAT